MGVGAGLYMCDVVVKSSRSLSHLLMSSCITSPPIGVQSIVMTVSVCLSVYLSFRSHISKMTSKLHEINRNFLYVLERCNPWPHVANRHVSISQLFSL